MEGEGRKFCPLIGDVCKESECVMWWQNSCALALAAQLFVVNQVVSVEVKQHLKESQGPVSVEFGEGAEQQSENLESILSETPEALAKEMISFIWKQFPEAREEYETAIWQYARFFWQQRGIKREWGLPPDVEMKKKRAEQIAKKWLMEERKRAREEELRKEKEQIPILAERCEKWAREHGLKRVTLADVRAFLLSIGVEVSTDTRRSIYSITNVRLKTKLPE